MPRLRREYNPHYLRRKNVETVIDYERGGYISVATIKKVLEDAKPRLEDWRKDNGEGLSLQEIRYNAASNVYEEIKNVLECPRLLASVAPIIICKDCKHYDHDPSDPVDEGLCTRRIATERMVKDNHFCGYAVRKEEE